MHTRRPWVFLIWNWLCQLTFNSEMGQWFFAVFIFPFSYFLYAFFSISNIKQFKDSFFPFDLFSCVSTLWKMATKIITNPLDGFQLKKYPQTRSRHSYNHWFQHVKTNLPFNREQVEADYNFNPSVPEASFPGFAFFSKFLTIERNERARKISSCTHIVSRIQKQNITKTLQRLI